MKVERRNLSQTLRLNGTTEASRSFVVLAPRLEGAQVGSMVVTKLVPAGTHVTSGDVLVEFDPQAQMKDYLDKKGTFDNLVSQVAQKQSDEDIARAKDDTAMKQAEDELKRAQLEIQRNEVVSRIDAEKNQEAVDEAQATLKQLKETYQLKRAAAQAGIRILEIQRDRAKEAMRYAQANAAKMTVHSPMAGIVVYNTIWLGGRMGTVQQGDQVRPGVPFLQVVDPSRMEVRVELNQVDLLKVHPGQKALMHLDAYPGLTLPTVLDELSPLGHTGQFTEMVRSFTARFSVQGTDPRLLPDLSAAMDLDLGSENKVLVVPYQSIGFASGHSFVWLRNGGSFEKRTVTVGQRNDLNAVVESGLTEGDVIRRDASDNSGATEQP
ncbi:MAG: HlyD family efflux transporter periplasmic adaptor subunit [Candidatus Acidiferrum sp.]